MRVAGHFNYPHLPDTVYRTFIDRDALLYSVPGLQTLTETAPDRYEASLRVGVGGFYLYYSGTLTLAERVENQQYRFLVDATTHNGYGKADAVFRFLPAPQGGTHVEYEADVELGGAQKLLPSLARGLVDFFLHGMDHWMKEAAAGRRPE
ncbi:MAG TPA: SRPBCC domain-containing protein [Symbiobacteriaceae bacterium]|jgi:uncharacterized protein|nr:SRPBCC domain-containing protein [Symbiobacteriaceae bacterium]